MAQAETRLQRGQAQVHGAAVGTGASPWPKKQPCLTLPSVPGLLPLPPPPTGLPVPPLLQCLYQQVPTPTITHSPA